MSQLRTGLRYLTNMSHLKEGERSMTARAGEGSAHAGTRKPEPGSESVPAAHVWPQASLSSGDSWSTRLTGNRPAQWVDPGEAAEWWLALAMLSPAPGSGSNVLLSKVLQMGKLRLCVCGGGSAAGWGPGWAGPRDPQTCRAEGPSGRAGGDNGAPTPRWTMATASSSSFLPVSTHFPACVRSAAGPGAPARPAVGGSGPLC